MRFDQIILNGARESFIRSKFVLDMQIEFEFQTMQIEFRFPVTTLSYRKILVTTSSLKCALYTGTYFYET